MTNNTTKPDSLQPGAETAVDLFDNWFDPIETEVRCACRKSNTHIQMMKSAKKWLRQNATNGKYRSRRRRVLVD